MKIEQVAFPLVIAAAVVGIWAAFRQNGSTVVQTTSGESSGLPTVAPTTTQVSLGNPQVLDGVTYLVNALRNPWAGSPGLDPNAGPVSASYSAGIGTAPGQPPAYLTYNLPPVWSPKVNAGGAAASMAGANGSGGCGGGCGGCGKRSNGCNGDTPAYTDGQGLNMVLQHPVTGYDLVMQGENLVSVGV